MISKTFPCSWFGLHAVSVHTLMSFAVALAVAGASPYATAQIVIEGGGLQLVEEGGAFAASNLASVTQGGAAFALDELITDEELFLKAYLNDGAYGAQSSWIGGGSAGVSGPFVGVRLSGSQSIQSFAFGRDNTGSATDRTLGQFALEYTNVSNPSATTIDADWIPIGTIDYQSAGGDSLFVEPSFRHRFNFAPVTATGLRLRIPHTGESLGSAIDELEVYAEAIPRQPPLPSLQILPTNGYEIARVGSEGQHSSPSLGAGPPANLASTSAGARAFASSELGDLLGGLHRTTHANDGIYGNNHSWMPDALLPDLDPFVGIDLNGLVSVDTLAWSRDNGVDDVVGDDTFCLNGECTDRTLGSYTIQYTQMPSPSSVSTESSDPLTGWAEIGDIEYLRNTPDFKSWLRHEFRLSANGEPIQATGLRLKLSVSQMVIDEIEVYGERASRLPGDADDDGVVDLDDLNAVRGNFGATGALLLGDVNGDQVVDLADLNAVRNHFGESVPGAAGVPEPASLVLLATAIVSMVAAKRRIVA